MREEPTCIIYLEYSSTSRLERYMWALITTQSLVERNSDRTYFQRFFTLGACDGAFMVFDSARIQDLSTTGGGKCLLFAYDMYCRS